MGGRLFPAVLRYWRARRGLSQLDLALQADVSARHISFLESARAKPSRDMVLRLLAVLDVPLRDQNRALESAGFEPRFAETGPDQLPAPVDQAIAQMMAQQEPYPLTVLGADARILRRNRAADTLFRAFVAEPERLPAAWDMFTLLFDPRLMRPFVLDWDALARAMISRLHRESLLRGGDERLDALLERVFAYADVPRQWRQPDFATDPPPTACVRLARGELAVGFLTCVTVFSAPQQVALEELRIESSFPLDDATRRVCERFATRP